MIPFIVVRRVNFYNYRLIQVKVKIKTQPRLDRCIIVDGKEDFMIERKNKKVIAAEAGILVVAICWGMGFVAGKYALQDMGPFDVLAYRYIFAFIIMLVCTFKHWKNITKKMLIGASGIGSLMFFGNMIQTIGLQYTTPGKQTFIICMYTVLVPLLSWLFFKERAPKNIIIAAIIAFVGIGLLTLKDNLTLGFGDILTFIFAITFSIHVILVGKFMTEDTDPLAFTLVQIGVCAVLSVIGMFIFGDCTPLTELSGPGALGLLQLILLNTTLAYLLQNACQKIAPANHVAILMSTETVFGTFFAVTLADETFTGRMMVGVVLMFIALVVSNIPMGKGNRQ